MAVQSVVDFQKNVLGLNQDDIFPGAKEKEEDNIQDTLAKERTQANFDRIQGNLKKLDEAGAPVGVLSRYLRTEDLSMFEPEQEEESVNPGTISLALARGSITGTASIAALPLIAVDYLAYGIASVFDDDAVKESFDSAGRVMQGARELNKILDPNFSFAGGKDFDEAGQKIGVTSTQTIRTAEKIGEFIAPGGILIKGMSIKGAKMLKKAPDIKRWWHKMFTEVAKDPRRAQMIEAGLGAGAATAGEMTATALLERGIPQEHIGWYRFGSEIAATIGIVGATSLARRIIDFGRNSLTLTKTARDAAAERNVGLLIAELFEFEPAILVNLAKAETIEETTGIILNLAQASRNPDIQATLNTILNTASDTGQTKFLMTVHANRKRLEDFTKEMRPILQKAGGPDLKTQLRRFMDNRFEELDTRLKLTERKAVEEADLLHPNRDSAQIGEAGEKQMASLEDAAELEVGKIYDSLDPDTVFGTNHLKAGMTFAKLSPDLKTAKESIQRIKAGGEPRGLLGKQTDFQDFPPDIIDAYVHNFQGVKTTSMQRLRDYRKMVGQEERIARMRGDTSLANRLDILRRSVDTQLKAAKGALSKSEAGILKEANVAWEAKKIRFDRSYKIVGIQRDLTGMYNFSPEDFGRLFVRSSGGKNAIESAKRFKQIFGVGTNGKLLPSAKALIRDTVKYELNALKKGKKGAINPTLVAGWLGRHKENLKAHGVWDDFKDVGRASRKADEVRIDVGIQRKMYNKSMLEAIVDSDDIGKTISRMLEDGSITRLRQELRQIKNSPAERGLSQELWDIVINKNNTGRFDDADNILRDPNSLLKILLEEKGELQRGLGKGHYKNLEIIASAIRRTEGKIPTTGKGFIRVEGAANQAEELAKGTSKIYAAARGFISPQFVAGSLLRQGVFIINSRAARHVIEEALYDWRYALKLAEAAKTRSGKLAFKAWGIDMIPMTIDVLNTEDERTEL